LCKCRKGKKALAQPNGTDELKAGERGALSSHTPVQPAFAKSSARVKKSSAFW